MDWPTLKDFVLFALAIYAALLSTLNWWQARNRERRNIQVNAGSAIPAYRDGGTGRTYAQITAVNAGLRPVTITSLTFSLQGGGRLAILDGDGLPGIPDTPLPTTLNDGQRAQMAVAYQDIAQSLQESGRRGVVKLTPICEDSTGTVHRGKSWTVDIEEFSRM